MDNKEINELYTFANKKILKYFNKYKTNYDEDIISQFRNDVFLKLVEIPDVGKVDNIDGFIYSMCTNHRIDYERKSKVRKELFTNIEDQDFKLDEPNIEERIIFDDTKNSKYLNLDKQTKQIINYKFEGYRHQEICNILNISRATLQRKLNLAKDKNHDHLQKRGK